MLSLLHIENIAVIECADITFDSGFNILTGETGAGKSIVIDAISAILGERAYRDMIRTGSTKASVRAVFTDVPEFPWFADNGVEYDPETIIQREVHLDGKNVCRVNGTLVTVSILRKLGIQLINIHGQHDSASLFDENNHLEFLDAFAENLPLREAYAEKYTAVAKLRKEIERLHMDESEKLRRMETLRYQIDEISKANLQAGEDETLEQRRKILQNAEKLSDGIHTAVDCLYGGDDSDGAASLLAEAERELARLVRYTDAYNELHEKVADLMYQVQDVAEELRDARDDLSYSADELEQIESRLDVIHRLRRKYGTTCEEILLYLDNAQIAMYDVEVIAVENMNPYQETDMMPTKGIFEDQKFSMITYQYNVNAGYVKGYAISGDVAAEDVQLNVMVTWKDSTRLNVSREFFEFNNLDAGAMGSHEGNDVQIGEIIDAEEE